MRARTQLKKWKQQSRAIQEKIGTESLKSPEALKQRIEKTFAELDSSGDGFIDFNELKVGMEEMGVVMNETTAKRLINEIDRNGDKQIDLQEWSALVRNTLESYRLIKLAPSATATNEGILAKKYTSSEICASPRAAQKFGGDPKPRDNGKPLPRRYRRRRASAPALMLADQLPHNIVGSVSPPSPTSPSELVAEEAAAANNNDDTDKKEKKQLGPLRRASTRAGIWPSMPSPGKSRRWRRRMSAPVLSSNQEGDTVQTTRIQLTTTSEENETATEADEPNTAETSADQSAESEVKLPVLPDRFKPEQCKTEQ